MQALLRVFPLELLLQVQLLQLLQALAWLQEPVCRLPEQPVRPQPPERLLLERPT